MELFHFNQYTFKFNPRYHCVSNLCFGSVSEMKINLNLKKRE